MTGLTIEMWSIDRLIPYEGKDGGGNARRITTAAIDKVAQSISRFGWQQPVVVEPAPNEGVIIIGHVRRLAALKLGLREAPVHVVRGLSPQQIRELRIADNRTHDEATFDVSVLLSEIKDLELEATGFDRWQLDEFSSVAAFEDEIVPLGIEGEEEEANGVGARNRNYDRARMVDAILYVEDVAVFENALRATNLANRGKALAAICQAYLETNSRSRKTTQPEA
ncbi:MAG TPA: ParB N-terminal domain-containing protein [Bryobacteraceae bacterium]|nr:ParB N-terminal domain-containing protein [Bryobacteraceae bacterium]